MTRLHKSGSSFNLLIYILVSFLAAIILSNCGGSSGGPASDKQAVASKVIDQAGGFILVDDQTSDLFGIRLDVPPGAVDKQTEFIISEYLSLPYFADELGDIPLALYLEPDGAVFNDFLTISIPYDDSLVDDETNLSVFTYDEELEIWDEIEIVELDIANNIITAKLANFSFLTLQEKDNIYIDNAAIVWNLMTDEDGDFVASATLTNDSIYNIRPAFIQSSFCDASLIADKMYTQSSEIEFIYYVKLYETINNWVDLQVGSTQKVSFVQSNIDSFSSLSVEVYKNDSLWFNSFDIVGYVHAVSSANEIQNLYNWYSGYPVLYKFDVKPEAGKEYYVKVYLKILYDNCQYYSYIKSENDAEKATSNLSSSLLIDAAPQNYIVDNFDSSSSDIDNDGDGYAEVDGDCDDENPDNFPGNPEICDGLDNNCDGQIDEGFLAFDVDGDGYTSIESCAGSADDCDDNDVSVYPGATEIYGDGIDQDCDGFDGFISSTWHDNRLINNLCSNCHTSDTSVLGLPGTGTLVDDADVDILHRSDCARCHGYSGTKIDAAIVEQAILDGLGGTQVTCLTCHESNFSTIHAFLESHTTLVTVGTTSCSNCHTSTLVDAADPKVHNSCSSCHDATGALISLAIGKSAPGDCTTCHTGPFETVHPVVLDHAVLIRVGSTSCSSCHSDPPPLVDAADPKLHDNCTSCHDATGALISLAVGKSFAAGGDCTTCHTAAFEAIHPGSVDHSALVRVGSTSCSSCHSDPPPLVNAADPKVHDSCTSCHAATGALISLAVGKSFAAGGDCSTCHTAQFETVHPDTIDHTAIVIAGTTSCSGCHSDPPPLTDAADPKVHNSCTSCHDANGGLLSLATGKSFAIGGDCTTCHTASFETVHSAATDHSDIVTTTATQCGSCHTSTLVDAADPRVHNSCFSCHDANGGLISLAIGKSAPGNCTSCHTASFETVHPDTIDHTAIVTAGTTSCSSCHSDPPPLTDAADPKVHDSCSTCHDANGGLLSLATGKSFAIGGDCTTCHTALFETVHSAATDHSDIVTTTATQCGSCHTSTLVDAADPKVHDSCSTCHDANGGLLSLATGKSFAIGGDCTSCHTASFETVHPDTIDHTAIVTAGTTSCSICHSDPPPLTDAADPKVHDSCSTCHDANGGLLSLAAGKSFAAGGDCTSCHTAQFDTIHPDTVDHSLAIQVTPDCDICHTSTVLVDPSDPTNHDSCGSCHDTEGSLISLAIGNTAPNECITCHGTDFGALHPSVSHSATPGSDDVLIFADGTHDDAITGDYVVYVACNTCHNTELGAVHGNSCSTCHPSPYDSLDGVWTGGCQQGGCHTIYHDDVTASHWTVEDQCTQCHVIPDWNVPATSCTNCHATYNPADTVPPVTTSDAQAIYVGAARINFSITDNGKVGVGIIYSRVDGGATETGSSAVITSPGSHSLEFWSVDQAGNVESPPNTANFVISEDTTPPVTTSNAQASYYGPANIMLTAIDNSTPGVKTTYYSLDGGPTQTGASVYVAPLPGTYSYTLDFWSDDWSGNVEATNTVSFTVTGGTGTLRLVWGDSDVSGSPCPGDPNAMANWTIRRGDAGGPIVATGFSVACPGWSGVDDVAVPVSLTAYYVSIDWWDDEFGFFDNTVFSNIYISIPGQIEVLSY